MDQHSFRMLTGVKHVYIDRNIGVVLIGSEDCRCKALAAIL